MVMPAPAPPLAARPTGDLLTRYARNPASFVVNYPGPWRWFRAPGLGGAVPYLQARHTALVWGDPLCAARDVPEVVARMTAAMTATGRRLCLALVQEDVARAALEAGHRVLKIGEEAMFELDGDQSLRGRALKRVRGHVNHARRHGVEVVVAAPGEAPAAGLAADVAEVQAAWEQRLGERVGRSVLEPAPLERVDEKWVLVARSGHEAHGFLTCTPVPGRDGWLLEDLVRHPDAVRGVTELLVVTANQALAAAGAARTWMGIAPLRGTEEQLDPRARRLMGAVRLAARRFDSRFDFSGTAAHQAKFQPTAWEPRFVTFHPPRLTPGLVRGAIAAIDPPADPWWTALRRRRHGRALPQPA